MAEREHQRILIGNTGVVVGTATCVHCPHPLNDHNAGGPGGYLTCDLCDCAGFCDRAAAWWLDEDDDEPPNADSRPSGLGE